MKSPFVYCSAVTREVNLYFVLSGDILISSQLLLRLERYPHRMNFAKGILEVRRQHYKHLKTILVSSPCANSFFQLSLCL